jgi:hypothetical protein
LINDIIIILPGLIVVGLLRGILSACSGMPRKAFMHVRPEIKRESKIV